MREVATAALIEATTLTKATTLSESTLTESTLTEAALIEATLVVVTLIKAALVVPYVLVASWSIVWRWVKGRSALIVSKGWLCRGRRTWGEEVTRNESRRSTKARVAVSWTVHWRRRVVDWCRRSSGHGASVVELILKQSSLESASSCRCKSSRGVARWRGGWTRNRSRSRKRGSSCKTLRASSGVLFRFNAKSLGTNDLLVRCSVDRFGVRGILNKSEGVGSVAWIGFGDDIDGFDLAVLVEHPKDFILAGTSGQVANKHRLDVRLISCNIVVLNTSGRSSKVELDLLFVARCQL